MGGCRWIQILGETEEDRWGSGDVDEIRGSAKMEGGRYTLGNYGDLGVVV